MSQIENHVPGAFCWVDLMTPDMAAATSFYEAIFGWRHRDETHPSGGVYRQLTCRELRVCGMGPMSSEMQASGMPSVWNSYVRVDDVEEICARAESLGGQVRMPAMAIDSSEGRAGRMAILVDPAGAAVSLWQPGYHKGAQLVNDPGGFAWNELLSRDVEASAHFYVGLFGWTIAGEETGGPAAYFEISNSGRRNGGIMPWRPEFGEAPPSWSVYFSVRDCDETVKNIRERGGQLLSGPIDIAPGRFAVCADPLGAVFKVIKLVDPE